MIRIGLWTLIFFGFGANACSRPASKPPRPNIIILSVDTLRADSLRAYDPSAPARPTMDRLAQQGRVFGRAYSTAPWTLPAHVSLFTGLYPAQHGVVDHKHAMGDVSSFVETLRAKGYQTIGFADGGYVSGDYGFSRGFEIYDDWHDEKSAAPPKALPRGGKRHFDTKQNPFDRASAFLAGRTDSRPLFLFAHTYAVHDYFRSWSPEQPGNEAQPTPESKSKLQCLLGVASCSSEKWRELESAYEGGIDAFDQALGAFLELIERSLGGSNTFVILLSDHGESFDPVRNRIHHGGRLHRDQLQVPLFVAGPGVKPGRSEELVSLVDVHGTVLELAGVAGDTKHDGRSFVPALFAKPIEGGRDAIFASDHFYFWQSGRRRTVLMPSEEPLTAARIDSRYWYVKDLYGEELYATQDAEQRKPLAELLKQRQNPSRQTEATRNKPTSFEPSEELVEQLRALGYVE